MHTRQYLRPRWLGELISRRRSAAKGISTPGILTLGILWMAAGVSCGRDSEGFTIQSASPQAGIRGSLVQNRVRIDFESRVSGDLLISEITAADGHLLWHYQEEGMRSTSLGDPAIFISGAEQFRANTADQVAQLTAAMNEHGVEGARALVHDKQRELDLATAAVAGSPEGALIKKLALRLEAHAGGTDVVAERRGLETAFQALQHAFPSGYPAEVTEQTGDYYYSPKAGYIVLTQHPRASFHHNLDREAHRGPDVHIQAVDEVLRDDGRQVGECFGHCGAGCTNDWGGCTHGDWSHVYSGDEFVAGQILLNCWCQASGREICEQYDVMQRMAWHTFRGAVAEGCIAHDGCCRTADWGCFNPACIALMPFALATSCCCSWDESWTYTGPQSVGIRYSGYVDIGACERG